MTRAALRRAVAPAAVLALAVAALGGPRCAMAATSAATDAATPIRIDGAFDDWPAGTFVAADDRYLYLRLVLPEERTLQASPLPLVVSIAADEHPSEATGFDPDLRIVFSPPEFDGQGVAVRGPPAGTGSGALRHAAIDLVVAPTVAAREFELRLAREVRGRPDLSAALASGRVRVQAALLRADGSPAWRSRVRQLELPPRAGVAAADTPAAAGLPSPAATPIAPLGIPAAAAGELRVVSWNVLLASPRKKPEPFARILRALRPDVVLLQEWEGASDAELAAWFDTHLPGTAPWHAVTSAGWGVAVVARAPLSALGPRLVARPVVAPADSRRSDAALRLAAAVATTPLGALCAASLHLKCCGAAHSAQDLARRAEAAAANEALRVALLEAAPCVRVVGGDLNLVGSRLPLEILAAGLDAGGAPLAIAESPVLAERALYTWFQPWSRFSPGRLDYLLYGAATARATRSFVLDTRRLEAPALAASGLEGNDAAASDHLPLVLDLAPIQSDSASGLANSRLSSTR